MLMQGENTAMKRIIAILSAALLLAALAAGCKDEPASVVVTEPEETTAELWTYPTLPETETALVEPTDEELQETAATTTTTRTTTTSRIPVLSGSAASTATTTRSTTTTTTRRAGNAITIGSKEEALCAFNSAVQNVTGGKAGFAKSHLVSAGDWDFDQALRDAAALPGLGSLVDTNAYLSRALNDALQKGAPTATAQKGSANSLIKNSTLTMGDLKDVSYTGSTGGRWTITLSVKDGETRQKKGGGRTGSSPIDKGPLGLATGSLYDHMDAEKIFALVSSLSVLSITPVDISESTSQVKFVATLDAEGRLVELKATFNQSINLRDITILGGMQSYKNNTGSSSVTVTYDGFVY